MAPTNNYDYNFPYFPLPPPHYNPPSPPKVAPPHSSPSPPNVPPPHNFPPPHITPPSPKVPPPPRHPITPPPPAHPFHPPPPHHIPPPPHVIPPPAPTPGHHSTVIIVVFVSLGGLFFLAFLSVALCCFIKKKKKKTVQKTEILEFDEHTKVHEAIVPGPHGEKITVLNIEEDVHLVEEIKKNEKLTEGSHIKSALDHPLGSDIATPSSQYNQQHLEHKV
ncbi:protein TRACHEARY ELEMENT DIFFERENTIATION-RELATED 7 [Populus alba]|uniref:Proline-rich receptor-like protein kinase PERK1 n=1 Tax=Populus alba x Populus x berolinensis TaxID=444605 RepID=A0AAD6QIZ8_9ROSI|nr:proline-rich receptor-like protein kinase PERK1 [Populus alba]KAJ6991145.1 proline-rich receptor-like protein kinase PERK1 [Populus alba x Populus x berolinensis]